MHADNVGSTWDLHGSFFSRELNQLVKITVTTLTASRMAVKRDRLDLLREIYDPLTRALEQTLL